MYEKLSLSIWTSILYSSLLIIEKMQQNLKYFNLMFLFKIALKGTYFCILFDYPL